MQRACMGKLMELAQADNRVLYLTADSGEGGLDRIFRMNFPGQSLEFGIAENGMAAAAAGLAMAGKIPFVYTAAPFLAYRSYEFIRDDICLQGLNVKLLAPGSGLSVGQLGPTHHTTEDIAALRALPDLLLLSPATPGQASEAVRIAYEHEGPVYIRLGMNGDKEFFGEQYRMRISGNDVLREGEDAVTYTTGSILEEVMEAAEQLERDGISLKVVDVSTLRPFRRDGFAEDARKYGMVFTVEEHSIRGGLGSILAEEAAYHGIPLRVCPIGLPDAFAEGYGTRKEVRRRNGLDAASICRKIKEGIGTYEHLYFRRDTGRAEVPFHPHGHE